MNNYFSKSVEETLEDFNVSKNGLDEKNLKSLKDKYGLNELEEGKKESIVKVFFSQFKDLLVIILIIAAIVSMIAKNAESTIVIFAVITMNAILGTIQHIKAEQSLKSLKALSSPTAKVIRNGVKQEVDSKELVPGDILLLEAGDFVSADGRIIENYSLQVNESSLTGESESVNKIVDIIDKEEVSLGDQKNLVFSGSLVTYGRALVVVTKTGMKTEIGKIAKLMTDTKEKKTPLQISLDDFGKKLAGVILAICAIVFCINVYRGNAVLDSIMFAVSLAVAAIPEALSSIVTIVLAIGTQKMAKENAIVKKLKSVEALGCVSVICSDKTGTLTQNKMTVKKVYVNNEIVNFDALDLNSEEQELLIKSALLCCDATCENNTEIGDPTEVALVKLGNIYNINEKQIRDDIKRIGEIPFDSDRKLMSTVHDINDKNVMFTKGALDVLLDRVSYIHTSKGVRTFTNEDKKNIESANKVLSSKGLRVLTFAYKETSHTDITLEDEDAYTFLGLISMIDPPREESEVAVRECINAGIKPVMITGDHKITACAIAEQIGILKDGDEALDGIEIDKLSDEELKSKVESTSVYARVSPEHKIRIVKAWQEKGKIVAMTGDGVNDAPALKASDIGIAMGITGTEVSKDAASMILTDDNFATIVKAVSNGRRVYNNIKNSILFLLSGNMAGVLCVLYASILALPMPFAAVHLLFINLLTDSLPAIAIGMEDNEDDLLSGAPRDVNESILSSKFMAKIFREGLLIGISTMMAFYVGLDKGGAALASTMAFSTLCLSRLFHGFNCRGDKSLFKLGLFTNKYSLMAFLAGVLMLNSVLLIEPLRNLFQVSALTKSQFMMIYLLAFLPTVVIQIMKKVMNDNDKVEIKEAKYSSR